MRLDVGMILYVRGLGLSRGPNQGVKRTLSTECCWLKLNCLFLLLGYGLLICFMHVMCTLYQLQCTNILCICVPSTIYIYYSVTSRGIVRYLFWIPYYWLRTLKNSYSIGNFPLCVIFIYRKSIVTLISKFVEMIKDLTHAWL